MPIRIHDVAERLNLSITTVSRALDGYDDVAEDTRQRVIQAAREMGYVPNRAARQLRKQRTETIGYILPMSAPRFSDPFFSEFIAGVGDEAAKNNFDLLISAAQLGEDAERLVYQRWVHGHRVDGYILNRMRLRDWRVQYLAQMNVPFVTLERTLDPLDYPSVEVDGHTGVMKVISYLAGKGIKRIAFIGASPELAIQADRYAGYRQGLQEAGITYTPEYVEEANLTRQGGYKAAKKLLTIANPPIAIVCINDLTAIGVLRCAHDLGLEVGSEILITGFDGVEETEHTQPPITTLNQPVYECGRELVKLLLSEIEGVPLANRRVQFQPELLLRSSTG